MRQYTRVLRVRGIGRTFTLGLCGKLAVIAIPIVLTLHVSLGLGRGLGQAGLVTGVWLLGLMVGSPAQGWAIDRRGMRSVLLLSAAAQAVFWSVASLLSYQELLVAAAASGLLLVPASTPVRLALTALVSVEDRQTAFAIDSLITELSYMTGPLIGVLLSTQVSTAVATRGLGGLLV
ncbi:MAG TPA: MFS transporter, partial [Pseudonocardiaceae bacterium]|nr:MFS transporter [Pseudonocardiaceae bacterium]